MSLPSEVTHPFNSGCPVCKDMIRLKTQEENDEIARRRDVRIINDSMNSLNNKEHVDDRVEKLTGGHREHYTTP